MRLVDRVVDVLSCLQDEAGGLGVTEISERTGLPKSTVHGLLNALAGRALVVQEPLTQRYGLGLGLVRMASVFLRERNLLLGVAQRHMERLRELSGETVCLHIPYGLERVCLAQVESFNAIRYTMEVGKPEPLYCGATGKLLLAYMPQEVVERVIEVSGLVPLTPYTITDPVALRRELAHIRARGYAVSYEERALLASAVSAPLRDGHGQVVGCLTVYGPRARLDEARVERLLPAVQSTAGELSRAVAAPPPQRLT
ncbi:MAG: IclR family transcriptional regulator [Chloroflexi bacterium]|nr:IclR family transcriptional regulator [Chloroflexota bacterium]